MRGKKGFTLIEVLVVIVIIAIVSLLAFPSYKRGRVTSQNEMARAKLLDVANAARLYNEDNRGADRVAGGFGEAALNGFDSPVRLFGTTGSSGDNTFSYLKVREWNTAASGVYHYRGYKFYVCNPDFNASSQPEGSGCTGKEIVTMLGPASSFDAGINPDAIAEYGAAKWWVSRENLGIIGSNYGG